MAKQDTEITWVDEATAAAMIGHTSIEWFRRKVKEGKLPISLSKPSYRKFLYNKADIDAYILSCSTLTNQKQTA